ncbi:Fc.00g086030.m01.CDS01 [Cosmosporella sp. VM-42]
MNPNTSIRLTPREQQLRRLLLDVAKSIDDSGHAPEPLVLRWAGGWVRDRLLNIESHDIDVAINAMTGVPFAQHMCDYCEQPEAMAKHSIGPDDIGSLHNVARNPEKSKHLETAMVKMFGLDLDFVNLRRETYTEDSRNPRMEFGTASEDALRRDATINALFYNLHTDQVEDLTGGLPDMAAKIIRTPLEPFQTFMDDPLRVLRLVRFASRLQFNIDPTTRNFMGNSSVLDALRVKISRERVGVELEKMLKGAHPSEALELIDELKLYHAIFTDPRQNTLPVPDITRWSTAYRCLQELVRHREPGSISDILIRDDDAAYLAWNMAAICPWMVVDEPPDPRRKANALPLVAVVSREGFKAPNKLSDVIAASYRHRHEILKLKQAVCNNEPFIHERDRFGMAIRKWDAQGGSWRVQVLNAMLTEALEGLEEWPDSATQEQQKFLTGWQKLLDHLTELDVYEAPSLKRLLDGRQLAQALGTKPGKWTGKALEVCIAWQLRHPNEKDPSGAIAEVRGQREVLGIP